MLSRVAANMYFPFGENLTNETGGLSSSISVLRHCPDAVSHIRLKTTKKVKITLMEILHGLLKNKREKKMYHAYQSPS